MLANGRTKVAQAYHFSVNDLTCRRGGRQVFSAVNFSLENGEALIVSGANGTGKTSLLRQLAGLLPADNALTFSDQEPLSSHAYFIGVKDGAKAHLSVRENLAFWAAMLGGENIEGALDAFSLRDLQDMPAQLLSSGQRRRLALSRLILGFKRLWLLDEPASMLDVENQARLNVIITQHLQSGGMVILSAHGAAGLSGAKTLNLDASAA